MRLLASFVRMLKAAWQPERRQGHDRTIEANIHIPVVDQTDASHVNRGSPVANYAQYDSDPSPPNCELIEVHVAELQQLFNVIDPSPFREKDLSTNVGAFI